MLLDRLKLLDPRRFFRKKEEEPKPEAEILEPELLIEDEAIHPDKDPTLKLIKQAVNLAFIGCYTFMVLFCLQFVGKVKFDIDLGITSGKPFHFTYDIGSVLNLLPLFAVLVVSFGILVYAKAWVNYFAEEKHVVAKWLAFTFGICAIGVVVLGSLSVNQEARQEDFRAGLIAEEQVDNKAAGQQAVIDGWTDRLNKMQEVGSQNPSVEAIAARGSPDGWRQKVAIAEVQYAEGKISLGRLERFKRAQTNADDASALQEKIDGAILAAASATTKAEVKGDVGAVMTDPVTAFVRDTTPWRMPLMVFTMDMILIFGLFLGDIRRKRLLAEWNAAILRRKADAETQSASAAQKPEEQKAQADPSSTETGNPQSGNETEKPSPDPAPGEEKANPSSGVEETTSRKTTEVESHTRRVYQRKLRAATLAELKAAGLVLEEPANDPVERPEGSPEQSEARQGVDEGGDPEGGAGAGGVPPVSEAGVGGGSGSDLTDEQPQMEDPAETQEGPEQGTEEPTGAEGDPARGNENEEAA